MIMIDQQIGNYVVRSPLGEGASAHVYRGEHMYLRTHAAIKVLRTKLAEKERVRFEEEACLVARLNHPHVVHLMEYGVQDGYPYLIMTEASESLRRKMPRGVPLSLDQLIIYVRQVASALQYIHNQGLVHRDVKPENILLNQKGEALLSDFGIATADSSQFSQAREEARGTAYYMAPEQWQGRPEAASDQYSLAIVAYEWLTGTPPFAGATLATLGIKHRSELPPPLRKRVPMLDPRIELVVLKALSKDPAERFLHVQEFATELEKTYLSVATKAFHPTEIVSPIPTQPRLRAVTLTSLKAVVPPALSLPSNPRLPVVSPPVPKIELAPTISPPPVAVPTEADISPQAVVTPPTPEQSSAPPAQQSRAKISRRQALLLGEGIALAGIVVGGAFLLSRSSLSQMVTTQMASPTPASLLHFTLSHTQPEIITGVAASPQGTLIASSSGTNGPTIEVWDTDTSNLPGYPYDGPFKNVNTLAWSASGQYLALASDDGKVYVWDNANHQLILAEHYTQDGNADGRDNKMKSVAWFRTDFLAASGDNGHVKIYQLQGQKMAEVYSFPLPVQVGDIDCVTWSSDGQFLAFGTGDTNEVQIWNIADKTFAHKPTLVSTLHHDFHVNGVIWSADKNQLISSTRSGYVRNWDVKDMHTPSLVSYILTGLNLAGIALSPDEKIVACLGSNGVLQLYDNFSRNKLWEYPRAQGSVTSVNWLAKGDGNGLAIGVQKTKNAIVEIWRMI